jgi:hypothetical protein
MEICLMLNRGVLVVSLVARVRRLTKVGLFWVNDPERYLTLRDSHY